MTFLQTWLRKPRATVRIDTSFAWAAWIDVLRRPFTGKQGNTRRSIEVLDRLSLGGKKSLLLISIGDRRLLVGVGENAAPSITTLKRDSGLSSSRLPAGKSRTLRAARMVR